MTENEAKKWLRAISATQRESNHTSSLEVRKEALYMAIQALEEMQTLKIENAELHCELQAINATLDLLMQETRNNAIDEFAEKLNTDVESFVAEVDGIRADLLTLDYFSEFVFDVAEQMKGEQNG